MKENLLLTSSSTAPEGGGYFIEEISNSDLVSYAQLASLSGISVGTLINEGAGWLKFNYEGKELIVAKKNIRQSISWVQLDNSGCVFGTKIITINGVQYKVRLLTGADTNPSVYASGFYVTGTHNSEWSQLFYPIVKDGTHVPIPPRDANAPYTESDLQMNQYPTSWCQETHGAGVTYRVYRGMLGCSYFANYINTSKTTSTGWRPCLELIN